MLQPFPRHEINSESRLPSSSELVYEKSWINVIQWLTGMKAKRARTVDSDIYRLVHYKLVSDVTADDRVRKDQTL